MTSFYSSNKYRKKQSQIAKKNWKEGKYDFLRKRKSKQCKRENCKNVFKSTPSNPKVFCSRSCSAKFNNRVRGPLSEETKLKISKANIGKKYPERRGKTLGEFECSNPNCRKLFSREPWTKPKFCSPNCSIRTIGSRPTSPKASRGRAGIRLDISKEIYFYSTWEANIARFYNYKNIMWRYAPKTFDMGGQRYTPDFYLPKHKKYVEVKNFWSKFSKERHKRFVENYPNVKIEVILKDKYKELEKKYSKYISEWE